MRPDHSQPYIKCPEKRATHTLEPRQLQFHAVDLFLLSRAMYYHRNSCIIPTQHIRARQLCFISILLAFRNFSTEARQKELRALGTVATPTTLLIEPR